MEGCWEMYYTDEGPKRCRERDCPRCQISELRGLLEEVLNEVPHGWGESFSESELAQRIREAVEK